VIDRNAIERFRAAIASHLGMQFEDSKLGELSDVLRVRMAALRASSVDAYITRLDETELAALAERLTIGETYFFRYREQFDAFAEVALPAALSTSRRPIRILSAGCATGEEAYTLAILSRDHTPSVEISGFDVNPAVVGRAKQASYSTWSLRETSQPTRDRYFTTEGAQHQLATDVRDMVRFEQRNLLHDDPVFWQPGSFDVVFCRNVIMYFSAEAMRVVVDRIARAMRPGGFLFLGHAETLRGISRAFHLCHTHETFYYQRKDGDVPWTSPEAPKRWVHEALPMPPTLDASWIDVIGQASERVARLTSTRAAPSPAPPVSNTKPVLDMMQNERFVDALELLGTLSPSDPETQLLRAVLLTNSGRHREAEQACAELLARDELNAGAHYLLALCREHAGDASGAHEQDRIATYLDAGFAMPHVHMGLLDRRAGHLTRAAVELQRALELLESEDPSRILLFGGGFSRETLAHLCRSELRRCGASP
jgi:chemotaxis protein methyltransferase CheR